MLLVMMMIIYTLVFQNLLHFDPMIKPMIHIKHPFSHVQTVLLHSQKQILLLYQLLSVIPLNLLTSTHTSQVIPFYDPSFFKYKNCFQGFFLPDDFSLDLHTLQHQQALNPVLNFVYHWIRHNAKPGYSTPLIHGFPLLHAYYKIFSHIFIDDGTNLIILYTRNNSFSDTQPNATPPLVYSNIKICLPFRPFKTGFCKLHAHRHTGTKITYNTFSQY